ncbi:MAG TPA: nitroreductase family protein [Candidatus Methanoperedenaceae archaeon]|nr:nitroreductase family protein [Candidatus Methanoperedenaceae archaeon]
MDCIDAIQGRRSIRRYKSLPVERKLIEKLLQITQMSPSAGNRQARDFVVVFDTAVKEKLAEAALSQEFIAEAPCVVVFCANIERSSARYGTRGELYALQDATIAAATFQIAAHTLGLGTCWVGAFDDEAVSDILHLPEKVIPVAIMPLGYPDEKPPVYGRIDVKKLMHLDTW